MVKKVIIWLLIIVNIILVCIIIGINGRESKTEILITSESASIESNNIYLPSSILEKDFENEYKWPTKDDIELHHQVFFGKWKVVCMVPIEMSIPSVYSGFDKNNNFRGQDLMDNIENKGEKYELKEGYKTFSVPIVSENTSVGSSSVKSLGITGGCLSIVFFEMINEGGNIEGKRGVPTVNQLYIKDSNTIYASINGYIIFKLERQISSTLD